MSERGSTQSRPGAGGPFWAQVREEIRATWQSRCRWLWVTLAVIGELLLSYLLESPASVAFQAASGSPSFDQWAFLALCGLACWVPAWLCSDLLSLNFPGNPDPHREWGPAEFLARALGRLLPFTAVLLMWAATLAGRSLLDQLATASGNNLFSFGLQEWGSFLPWWSAWTVVFVASGLPYAAGAALLSATARRPRRWLITPAAIIATTGGMLGLLALTPTWVHQGMSLISTWLNGPLPDVLRQAVLAPNFMIGVQAGGALLTVGRAVSAGRWNTDFGGLCIAASLCFVAFAVPLASAVGWIAARRLRRHPRSAGPAGRAAFSTAGDG